MPTPTPPKLVLIGIQARSTSERLPGKVLMELGDRPVLTHVIDTCKQAAAYLNRNFSKLNAVAKVAVLAPKNDPLVSKYNRKITVIEGDEDDVLSRYVKAAHEECADYIVRITADCPFMASHVISRCAKAAIIKKQDYTTNILYRTFIEGQDVEVLTKRLLFWLDENAKEKEDREHVTYLLYKLFQLGKFPILHGSGKPSINHILNEFDFSDIKTSIDTMADFAKAQMIYHALQTKKEEARANGIIEEQRI